jgi:hypothetical protein
VVVIVHYWRKSARYKFFANKKWKIGMPSQGMLSAKMQIWVSKNEDDSQRLPKKIPFGCC